MGQLIVVRHHESEWNKLGKWTGTTDVHLTPYGVEKSKEMGMFLKGMNIDQAFTSKLARTIETLEAVLSTAIPESAGENLPVERVAALNERDYGDYTGKNKWEVKELVGEEEFDNIRRDWDHPVPKGETLKMVYARVLPFFTETVLPLLQNGKNILIVASGNSIRALMKYIEQIADTEMKNVEMPFGAVVFYDLDHEGHMIHKEMKKVDSKINA